MEPIRQRQRRTERKEKIKMYKIKKEETNIPLFHFTFIICVKDVFTDIQVLYQKQKNPVIF